MARSEWSYRRLFEWVAGHVRLVVAIGLAVTVVLAAVGDLWGSDEEPNFSPSGEIYDTEDRVADLFSPVDSDVSALFIVEAKSDVGVRTGDVLTHAALSEWLANSVALRADEESGDHLVTKFDTDLDVEISGVYSIADAVDSHLPGGLAGADDGDVKVALSELLAPGASTEGLRDTLSRLARARTEEVGGERIEVWRAPAFTAEVVYDFDSFDIGDIPDDSELRDFEYLTEAQTWLRDVQTLLQGDQVNFNALGIAIDDILQAEEEANESLPFVLIAVIVIVMLVGALLRSYWAAALVASGLAVTMIWLGGITALLGFKGGLLVKFIIPIAVISFGVDFFIHASGRTREEQVRGEPRDRAYLRGMSAVGPAIALAVASSIAAFLSNVASGIQAIIQFGVAGAFALLFAYMTLGVVVPKLLLDVEERVGPAPVHHGLGLGRKAGFVVMSLFAGATVMGAVAASTIGLVALAVFVGVFIMLPMRLTGRRNARAAAAGTEPADQIEGAGHGFAAAGSVVHFLGRWRVVTVPVVVVLAVLGIYGFTQTEEEFSFSDFFSSSSDFIQSIDKAETHYGESTGLAAYIFVEGDLTSPSTLAAMEAALVEVGESDAQLARDVDGELETSFDAVTLVNTVVGSQAARDAVEADTGVAVTDTDGDGLADSSAQVAAIYAHARANGVTVDDGQLVFSPDTVAQMVHADGDGYATVLAVEITTLSVEDSVVLPARAVLQAAADDLRDAVAGTGVRTVAVSGEAILMQDTLSAFTDSMLLALPIALILCALLAWMFMRSVKYALVAITPILLVVGWVYTFMWLADYKITVVTATIAAIAVGIGIDYATHFTMRFREEFDGEPSRFPAMRRAGEGTGGALAISALTSIVGFAVMAFAPMPVFADYGLLTAVMITLSLAVSLLVLPSLLLLATRSRRGEERRRLEEEITHGEFEYLPHDPRTAELPHERAPGLDLREPAPDETPPAEKEPTPTR